MAHHHQCVLVVLIYWIGTNVKNCIIFSNSYIDFLCTNLQYSKSYKFKLLSIFEFELFLLTCASETFFWYLNLESLYSCVHLNHCSILSDLNVSIWIVFAYVCIWNFVFYLWIWNLSIHVCIWTFLSPIWIWNFNANVLICNLLLDTVIVYLVCSGWGIHQNGSQTQQINFWRGP